MKLLIHSQTSTVYLLKLGNGYVISFHTLLGNPITYPCPIYIPMRKKISIVTAHHELTVTKMVTASRDWAVTWAVIELWPSRDWAVIILKMPWLSFDLAVTELWPRRDWAVTSPSRDWAVIIGPGAVTAVVTVSSRWAHGDNFFSWVAIAVDKYCLVYLIQWIEGLHGSKLRKLYL